MNILLNEPLRQSLRVRGGFRASEERVNRDADDDDEARYKCCTCVYDERCGWCRRSCLLDAASVVNGVFLSLFGKQLWGIFGCGISIGAPIKLISAGIACNFRFLVQCRVSCRIWLLENTCGVRGKQS